MIAGKSDLHTSSEQVSASAIEEFRPGTKFKPVLVRPAPGKLQRIVLLSGKAYYDIIKEVEKRGSQEIAVVRLEEISPFPFSGLKEALESLVQNMDTLPEIVWMQEEARNQGAYSYVAPRLASLWDTLGWTGANMRYIGRVESEVPAVGATVLHNVDKQHFLENAVSLSADHVNFFISRSKFHISNH